AGIAAVGAHQLLQSDLPVRLPGHPPGTGSAAPRVAPDRSHRHRRSGRRLSAADPEDLADPGAGLTDGRTAGVAGARRGGAARTADRAVLLVDHHPCDPELRRTLGPSSDGAAGGAADRAADATVAADPADARWPRPVADAGDPAADSGARTAGGAA